MDIEKLIKKIDEQDVIVINQINGLFERTYELMNRILSLEITMAKQHDSMNKKYEKISSLIYDEYNIRMYRVVWKTGHNQTVLARNSSDAYRKVTKDFSGSDSVVDIFVEGLR